MPETKPVSDIGEWKNVTLRPVTTTSIPDRPLMDKHVTLPIVPPRRKKTEKLVRSGGFKDVFGNLTRPPSCDSNISTIKDLEVRRWKSSSDIPPGEEISISSTDDLAKKSTLVRKVSKVGNRKSDQFFGENLSDCLSDEPVIDVTPKEIEKPKLVEKPSEHPEVYVDEIDAFVLSNASKLESIDVQGKAHRNVTNAEDKLTDEATEAVNLNKKAEFLMAMLDEYNSDEMRYYGTAPVEEPIIVPKRKHGRHICDDHDKLKNALSTTEISFTDGHNHSHLDNSRSHPSEEHHHVHKPARRHSKKDEHHDDGHKNHSKHSHSAKEPKPTPRKPDRDMDKYRNSMELKVPPRPILARSLEAIQNESLDERIAPIPAFNHSSQTGKSNLLDIPFDGVASPTLDEIEKLDTILKKCSSSQSFLTPDLMDQIVNKVYGFKMNWNDHDNVHHSGYDDYSEQVAPSSKLTTRKISVIRKDQITEKPIVEEGAEVEKLANDQSQQLVVDKNIENDKNPPTKFSIGDVSIKVSDVKYVTAPSQKNEEHTERLGKDVALDSNGLNKEQDVDESRTKFEDLKIAKKESELTTEQVEKKPTLDEFHKKFEGELKISKKESEITKEQIENSHGTPTKQLEKDVLPSAKSIKDPEVTSQNNIDHAEITKHVLKKSDTVIQIKQLPIPSNPSSHVLDDISTQTRSVLSSFQTSPTELSKNTVPKTSNASVHNHSSDESSDTDTSSVILNNDRRGSIVDHDVWFNEHNSTGSVYKPLPCETDVMKTYDTKKIYPFGTREKTLSESSDFFVTKVEVAIIDNADKAIKKLGSTKTEAKEEQNNDHSTLLKFLPSPK